MEIIAVNHEELGVQESKAKEISLMFKPMLDKMVELEEQANTVLALPMGPEAYAEARALRLEYKKTRTGTAEIHKKAKAYSLAVGRLIDGWKNAQRVAAHGIEDKLAAIENHEVLEAQKKIAALQEKRAKALAKFDVEVVPENLGELDTVMWNNYLTGTKVNFDKRKAEEKRIEADRLAKEVQAEKDRQAQKVEDERIREENRRLAKELLKKEEEQKKADKIRAKKEEEVRLAAALQRQEEEAKLKREREAREKAEKELKERQEEEERRVRAKEKDIQDALNADDSTKVNLLIEDLEEVAQKYTFKSDKNQEMYDNVGILIGKVITFIQK